MPLSAQSLDQKAWIQGSVYYPAVDTHVRVDADVGGGVGTDIDFEKDLNFPNRETLPSVSAGVRLGRSWRMMADFYRLDRSKTSTIARDIEFDGVTYPASASVTGQFRSDIYRLTFGYSFYQTPEFEFGATLGAHITNFVVSLEGDASVGEAGVEFRQRRKQVLAPLPTIGLYGGFRPTDKVTVAGRFDWLSLTVDGYSGRLWNTQASASYAVTPNVALGVMYRYVNYRLGADRDNWSGRITYRFSGPAAFLEVGFGGQQKPADRGD
jgi:hypothetical protein